MSDGKKGILETTGAFLQKLDASGADGHMLDEIEELKQVFHRSWIT